MVGREAVIPAGALEEISQQALMPHGAEDPVAHRLFIAQHTVEQLRDQLRKRDLSISILLKETAAQKASIERLTTDNVRLQERLIQSQRDAQQQMEDAKRRMGTAGELSLHTDHPSVHYMNLCYSTGLHPNRDLLACLHHATAITCPDPLNSQEVEVLREVMSLRQTQNTRRWQHWSKLELVPGDDTVYAPLCELILQLNHLTSIQLTNITDHGVIGVCDVLKRCTQVSELILPDPTLGDAAIIELVKLQQHREGAAGATRPRTPPSIGPSGGSLRGGSTTSSASLPRPSISLPPIPAPLKLVELSVTTPLAASVFDIFRFRTLRTLSLHDQPYLSDAALENLAKGVPRISTLRLTKCPALTDGCLPTFADGLNGVDELEVVECPRITKLNFPHVHVLIADFQNVTAVECASLQHIPPELRCFAVAVMRCPALTQLSLNGLLISEKQLQLIADSSALSLENLSLAGCRVTGLPTLLNRCRHVERLNLAKCQGVKNADLHSLPARLSMVDLSHCFFIDDGGALVLAQTCQKLRHVSLQFCSNLTDVTLGYLTEYCPQLRVVNLLGCRKMTTFGLDKFSTKCRDLETLVHEDYNPPAVLFHPHPPPPRVTAPSQAHKPQPPPPPPAHSTPTSGSGSGGVAPRALPASPVRGAPRGPTGAARPPSEQDNRLARWMAPHAQIPLTPTFGLFRFEDFGVQIAGGLQPNTPRGVQAVYSPMVGMDAVQDDVGFRTAQRTPTPDPPSSTPSLPLLNTNRSAVAQ